MQIIIPMAGTGSRFIRAGYKTIKPLIEVDGMPIIEHIVRMYPGEQNFSFICSNDHLRDSNLRAVLERIAPGAQIVGIAPHKLGPVHTVLEACDIIKDDEPVVVNYCDFSVYWDYLDFKKRMKELNCAGCITAYRGFHPHSLGPNLYAYMREKDNYLLEIQEKHCFTNHRLDEFASAGTYYFQSGALLKYYFRKAIKRSLQTNGEFYVSMPFNFLIEDGLEVYIYELEHFLQWGTPEDLEEYLAWSRYFSHYAHWKPSSTALPGLNLLPMAGAGVRFSREGYSQPKPLVPVAQVPLVRRTLDSLPPATDWIALCRTEHLKNPILEKVLGANGRQIQIIPVSQLTEGQACTCLLARQHLDADAPLLIASCDAIVVYNEDEYAALTSDPNIDCLVWTFRNHAHANRYPEQWGWVKTSSTNAVTGISCKMPISHDPRRDPGIIGTFWFRKAQYFLEAADALIVQNRRINNEFYVDSIIQVAVEQGHQARFFDVSHFISLGNPDDVKTYEYYEAYYRKAPHHPYGKEQIR